MNIPVIQYQGREQECLLLFLLLRVFDDGVYFLHMRETTYVPDMSKVSWNSPLPLYP